MNRTFKQTFFQTATALAVGIVAFAFNATAQSTPHPAAESVIKRIGIYDSRAIAVAYAGSTFQRAKMNDLVSQQKKAKADGDPNEIARIEAEGRAWQARLHNQGFSTAPVDDLLVHITNAVSQIQADAGVTRIISKWNEPELQKYADAEKVDVTMKLVDGFHPSERQRRHAIEIQKKKPVKLKE